MASTIAHDLNRALNKIDRPGSFCVSGSAAAVLPGLEVKGLGPIGLPLSAKQAKELMKHCEQAPYGKGEKTLVDVDVRRVWRLKPKRFALENPEWGEFLRQTLSTVQQGLGLEGQKLESHLYELLLYEPGSFFLPHRDGEKLERMVATLVVVLPASFRGGELIVRHEGQEQKIKLGGDNKFRTHFAAFYADCEHEIRPLREGYRICLVYNLTLAKAKKTAIRAPRSGEHIDEIGQILSRWSKKETPTKLAVPLEHQYTQDGLSWDVLKGVDRRKARVLCDAARQADCKAYLALLTLWESGSAEPSGGYGGGYYDEYEDEDDDDYEMGEIFDSSLTAEHWSDDQGKRLSIGAMDVEADEVVPPDSLTDIDPEEDFEGYTGNAGMTLERWYRHAAIILWPNQRHYDVLCDCGIRSAVAGLEEMVAQWQKAPVKKAADLKSQCLEFADRIIAHWPENSHSSPYLTSETCSLSALLAKLDDPGLIRTFLGEVLLKDATVDAGKGLPKAFDRHGWATFRKELAAVFERTTRESLERNVGLLEQLCLAKSRSQGEQFKLCQNLATALIAALEAMDRRRDPNDWRAREINRSQVLSQLSKSLIATEQFELLNRLVAHVLSVPKIYDLMLAHVPALSSLKPWLKKQLKRPCATMSRWLRSCCEQFESLTAQVPRKPADFRRSADIPCKCLDCRELKKFLTDPVEKVHRFSMAKERRGHLHQIIDTHECDVDHVTERVGSPQTLVCTKNTKSNERSLKKYRQDLEHLAALRGILASLPK